MRAKIIVKKPVSMFFGKTVGDYENEIIVLFRNLAKKWEESKTEAAVLDPGISYLAQGLDVRVCNTRDYIIQCDGPLFGWCILEFPTANRKNTIYFDWILLKRLARLIEYGEID